LLDLDFETVLDRFVNAVPGEMEGADHLIQSMMLKGLEFIDFLSGFLDGEARRLIRRARDT